MLGSLLTAEKLEIQNQDDRKDKSADDWSHDPFVLGDPPRHRSQDSFALVDGVVNSMKLQ